ncbi:MAG: UDP-N-acetylmuramate--L-alanine ligase [Alphaproteobacteria bacterium]|jgi:UDP-N-acetylmuramate--alanine ligase|nr:UDP-N-acetylmuramate--L-alanine ligase [Alphaproteobacteria bacterium]MDP6591127.1 UDP-N-acetylmuramate--L-alanine ligase [Alphaproteobacteria bacterium]
MKALPLSIGTIHFVGIGGIGMSGIAEVMRNLGYAVQGSDLSENANVRRLGALGIDIAIGHDASAIGDAQVVVISSAVKEDNVEAAAARQRFIPVVRRAEMLAELMRLKWSVAVAGTHGKTTTTSMIAAMLDGAGLDPTVINGGIINAYGTNARLGAGDWMVVEADESDGSFVKLPATVAVVTNIDPEHMEFYGEFDAVRDAYRTFLENLPFYGFAALCLDHPEVQALVGRISDRRIVTYGMSPQAEIRAFDTRSDALGSIFNVDISDRLSGTSQTLENLRLPMLGAHNVQNALAAIAIAREMKIPEQTMRRALNDFAGVKRRFTKTGVTDGITVIDDYGHHPVEISAVLKSARDAYEGRIIAVVQPHRFTRLRDLFEDFCSCFNDADAVIVAPVHAAGEAPIEGYDRDSLVEGLRARGHRQVTALDAPEQLADIIGPLAEPGDLVVFLGAGTITNWANDLPEALAVWRQAPARRGNGQVSGGGAS